MKELVEISRRTGFEACKVQILKTNLKGLIKEHRTRRDMDREYFRRLIVEDLEKREGDYTANKIRHCYQEYKELILNRASTQMRDEFEADTSLGYADGIFQNCWRSRKWGGIRKIFHEEVKTWNLPCFLGRQEDIINNEIIKPYFLERIEPALLQRNERNKMDKKLVLDQKALTTIAKVIASKLMTRFILGTGKEDIRELMSKEDTWEYNQGLITEMYENHLGVPQAHFEEELKKKLTKWQWLGLDKLEELVQTIAKKMINDENFITDSQFEENGVTEESMLLGDDDCSKFFQNSPRDFAEKILTEYQERMRADSRNSYSD